MKTCNQETLDSLADHEGWIVVLEEADYAGDIEQNTTDIATNTASISAMAALLAAAEVWTGCARISTYSGVYIATGNYRSMFYQDGTNGSNGVITEDYDEADIFTIDTDMQTGVSYITTPSSGYLQLSGHLVMKVGNATGIRTILIAEYSSPTAIGTLPTPFFSQQLTPNQLANSHDDIYFHTPIYKIGTGNGKLKPNTNYMLYWQHTDGANLELGYNCHIQYFYLGTNE